MAMDASSGGKAPAIGSDFPTYILTLSAPDRLGLVADVAASMAAYGCNIVESGQFSDPDTDRFFLRNAFRPTSGARLDSLRRDFADVAGRYGRWRTSSPPWPRSGR